ncbi:hypothetical protein [Neptunomonas japonica]|uniref:Uncharacterized protein n=1 Tax=Neptunomonas japonica JAMM 1380 TaxID=1441457 RepID=A0A7R6PL17_9GAMM|nr:hypothetical protein [Neptunomonas japonica]BBB31071.1 conserved hypothetical protein [Neptunomonas japonica JAMM 1380]
MRWRATKRRLIKQADNYQQNLILLISGFGLCMLGILLITIAEFLFGQSLQQELVALLGMALIAIGVLLALAGYISLSILRVFRFLISDEEKSKNKT